MKHDQSLSPLETDLADLARLVANGSMRDVQLFLARLIRKYRVTNPELSRRLDDSYEQIRKGTGLGEPLRRSPTAGR